MRAIKKKGIKPNTLPVASPNLSGQVERFIQTRECLCKCGTCITSLGKRVDYYNKTVSHMERGHLMPISETPGK